MHLEIMLQPDGLGGFTADKGKVTGLLRSIWLSPEAVFRISGTDGKGLADHIRGPGGDELLSRVNISGCGARVDAFSPAHVPILSGGEATPLDAINIILLDVGRVREPLGKNGLGCLTISQSIDIVDGKTIRRAVEHALTKPAPELSIGKAGLWSRFDSI